MPREAASNDDAISTVFDNLNLDPKEFGMGGGDDDEIENDLGDTEGDDDAGGDDKGPEDFSSDDDDDGDDEVVSHNKDDEDDEPSRGQDDELGDQRQEDNQFLPRAKIDKKGNVRDKNGKILAPAGVAARLYRKAYRAERTAQHLHRNATDLGNRLKKAIEIGTAAFDRLEALERDGTGIPAARDLGLSNSEQLEALQMFHLGKTNPTDLLKKILTRAAVSGIDVKNLGLQGGIDAKALTETILTELRKDLKPVRELTESQKRQQDDAAALTQRQEAVTAELTDFFNANPGAQKFLPVFRKVYSNPAFAKMPISEAWARIQLNFMRRSQQRPNPQNQRRRPNGQRRGGGRGGDEQPRSVMADLDKSYDQLLREVMTEHMPRRRG